MVSNDRIIFDIENYWGINYSKSNESLVIINKLEFDYSGTDCIVIPTFWPEFQDLILKLRNNKNWKNKPIFQI